MISKNIIILIIALIAIGIIVYFYYHYSNSTDNVIKPKLYKYKLNKRKPFKKSQQKSKKKVRFNDKVEYNIYQNNQNSSMEKESYQDIFDLDSSPSGDLISSPIKSPQSQNSLDSLDSLLFYGINSLSPKSDIINNGMEIELDSDIMPCNHLSPEEKWDAHFGLPLMNKEEKKKYTNKILKDHKLYGNSLGKFTEYQMDRNTINQNETTINPFKPNHQSCQLKNKTIKEIYDEQVAGPKPIPKKIEKITKDGITYQNESELNGGRLKGTYLKAFDNINDPYKNATFGNEF